MAASNPSIKDDEFHVFISFAQKDVSISHTFLEKLRQKGFKCFHSDNDFVPGATINANLLNGVTKSKRVLPIVSRAFVKSQWTSVEVGLAEIKNHYSGIVSCIPVVVEDDFNFEDPDFPKDIASVNCLRYKDTPEFWDKLAKAICADVPLSQAIPAGDISHGLAWSYYYGYLSIVLPGLPGGIKEWREQNGKPHSGDVFMEEMVILIPESCQGRNRIPDYDPDYIKLMPQNIVIKQDRVGNVGRDYSVQLYQITNPKNPNEQYYVVIALNAAVHAMYEMKQDKMAGLDGYQMMKQRVMFEEKLKNILDNSLNESCRGKSIIFSFKDTEGSQPSLAEIITEKCRTRLERKKRGNELAQDIARIRSEDGTAAMD